MDWINAEIYPKSISTRAAIGPAQPRRPACGVHARAGGVACTAGGRQLRVRVGSVRLAECVGPAFRACGSPDLPKRLEEVMAFICDWNGSPRKGWVGHPGDLTLSPHRGATGLGLAPRS